MRGVGESTKGKMKALDLYVCLLLQASLVQQKNFKRCRLQRLRILSAVGYNARKSLAL
jgi:hypothetical protein